MLTKSDIAESLTRLGVKSGMNLMVHSSLSSFGYVEGGAAAVIDALLDVIGPTGTLMMPSFNHGAPYDKGGVFDIRETPTTNGAIPETFWRMEGAKRSMNPTHAFAALGPKAERYTRDHQKTDAMGADSPLMRLMEDDGRCLLLGVGYTRNTFHHVVETVTRAPCLEPRGEIYKAIDEDGREILAHTWTWRNGFCPIDDAARYAPLMANVDRKMMIGDCEATLYRLKDGYEVIAKCLREGLDGFPPCSECPVRPRTGYGERR